MNTSLKAILVHAGIAALIAAMMTAGALAAYDRHVVRPAQRVGVVDVGEVYRLKEAEFTQLLTRAATEGERERAYALARRFSQRLPAALEELPRDCACLVVLKSAVAGPTPHTVDLTALLQQKVRQLPEAR
jgi:NAD-dependent oxidoreductase involved in siderophore biosynthesis